MITTSTHSAALADAGGDSLLIEAYAKYRSAMVRNADLNSSIGPLYDAALASVPPLELPIDYHSLPEEERNAFQDRRDLQFREAFKRQPGLDDLWNEQARLWENVIEPLGELILNTAPVSLEGVALKAVWLRDYVRPSMLETDDPNTLDWDDLAMHRFIEQLVAISKGDAQ